MVKFSSAVRSILCILKLLPINKTNYLSYLRQKYGPFVSDSALQYGKILLKITKIRHDLQFLKTCKNENLLPTFVRFRLRSFHQRYKSSILKCYHDILISEIKFKKRQLSRLYRLSHRLKNDLIANINHIVYVRITSILQSLVKQNEKNLLLVHENKLNKLRLKHHTPPSNEKTFEYPKNHVKKFSKRNLTREEINALSNGLEFVLPSRKLDDETLIASVETFFFALLGYTTDQKEFEKKYENERAQYKLTSEQLQYATKIRRVTDEFRHKTSILLKKCGASDPKSLALIKNLARDKSIIITKADKGRTVVLLDREEYINKMENLISDHTTFKQIYEDPTIAEEDRLTRKLRQMKERDFITEQEYNHCYPSGSQPARLYGLPKVHKPGLPLRPILSASGTFNYGIAQLLVRRLSHLKKHPTIVTDTFKLVDELHSLKIDMNQHKLVSFDVVSLFTNVPLNDTIKIILDELYRDECQCTTSHNNHTLNTKKKKQEKCKICLDRADMKWLLETATSRTHFLFNGKIYSQINGVAMGSPVGPLLADIFLVHLEKKLMSQLKQQGVVYWKRYVDDILAIIKNDTDIDQLKTTLNSFHKSIQFTAELETDRSLPFLNILIRRRPNHNTSWFLTDIYRKPMYTGLILKWNSSVPLEHKRSAISSMVYTAIRIISDYSLLHKEFLFIRQIAVSNGYPLPFVLNVIRITLERHLFSYSTTNSSLKTEQNKIEKNTNVCNKQSLQKNQVILVDIPYVGRLTSTFGKKLINISKQAKPTSHVQPIPRPGPKIQTFFAKKDPIPKELLSNVVYKVNCTCCSASYIGKTCRQISRRFEEHGREKIPSVAQSQLPLASTTTSIISQRSKRNVSIINYALCEKKLDEAVNENTKQLSGKKFSKLSQSAIYQHELETGHSINWTNWKLLSKDKKYYRLLVRESIQISKFEPSLNRTVRSVPLVIYPEISSLYKPRVKMKADL